MELQHTHSHVTDEDRRQFLKILGVGGAVGVAGEFTLSELRNAVTVESAGELAAMGEALRNDLTGALDAALLTTEMEALAGEIGRVPEVRAAGVPASADQELYAGLTAPAWRIHDHLAEVGFFESAEAHLPAFTSDHVASATKELVATASLASILSEVGFDEAERTELVTNAVANNDWLAQWVPVEAYREEDLGIGDESINPEAVAPVHERAAGGALLWIDGIDWHVWQNEVLVTEEALDAGAWDVKSLLGGFYLLASAADGIAREAVSDEQLSALITGSSSIMIASQTDLANDVGRIADLTRAPVGGV